MSVPIILDCDPGHDDAIALLLAVASPEVELVAVTTVAGNQTVDKTTNNALRRILRKIGEGDVPNLGDTTILAAPNVVDDPVKNAKR